MSLDIPGMALIDQRRRESDMVRTGHSPFLALSAELRNRIYSILFEHNDPVYVAPLG